MNSKLIINADDFGFDKDTFTSTVVLFERGVLSSATIIIVDMPYSKETMDFAVKNQDKFLFGLHFNIVDNHISKYGNNSLTNSKGFFNNGNLQIKKVLFKLSKQDIQNEFEYKLTTLSNWNQL